MTPRPEIQIRAADVNRYLLLGRHAPDAALAEAMARLRDAALQVIRPARTWRRIARVPTESKTLARHLDGCHAVYYVCGTLGAAFDALLRRTAVRSAADTLVLQAIGAAAIEEWMDIAEDEIRRELEEGETLVPRYSPGFGDFPLTAQREILSVLDAARAIGVSLTDTLLMVPSKSVSAVIGVKKAEMGPRDGFG